MIALARCCFSAILIFAPWAYGGTTTWAISLLNELLWACLGLHLVAWIVDKRRPFVPLFPLIFWLLLLLQASWMWYNAHFYHDDSFWQFIELSPPYPSLPGSMDKAATLFTLKWISALGAAFVIASDLISDNLWRQRLWTTIGGTTVSIVILGLMQRVFHAPSIFWINQQTGNTFFGTYRYHANAGAYLNLTWPILAALTVKAWRNSEDHVPRALWLGALLLTLAACFINVSRGAAAITLLLLIPALVAFVPYLRIEHRFSQWRTGLVVALLFIVFFLALFFSGALNLAEQHAALLTNQISTDNPRYLVTLTDLHIIPKAGWFGFGPGTFSCIFPYFTTHLGNKVAGFWKYSHEDYLQTLIEYGYLGAAAWSFLFFGGLVRTIRGSLHTHLRSFDSIDQRALTLALAGIALHSLFDFPLQIYSLQLIVMVYLALAWNPLKPKSQIANSK